jgi:putative ABC transport system substrate-binding protein
MRRRDFISWVGGVAAAWPLAASGQQQPTMPVIGFLNNLSPDLLPDHVREFRRGLSESGYVEGRNVAIEYRWANGDNDRLSALAADLVRSRPAVIAALGTGDAAKAVTTTIPTVFLSGADPVKAGLVTSLNRPGGNLTGVTTLNEELVPKRLELLHELAPAVTSVGVLVNPTNPNAGEITELLQPAARALGLQLYFLRASADRDFDTAFATMVQLRPTALMITPDGLLINHSKQLAALAAHHAVPAISQFREFPLVGGLMSYGTDLKAAYHVVGLYTGRILNGTKPAELPVQQTTKSRVCHQFKIRESARH